MYHLKSIGKKIIYYGDRTWANLFPDSFDRFETVFGNVVSDTVEVDLNVTRNVDRELERNDWDVMILHYLGLDHIGHMEGPTSSLLNPKRTEMDDVVEKIYSYIEEHDALDNRHTLFVLIGDHGMTEAGSHGGPSDTETSAGLVFLSPTFKKGGQDMRVSQIDVVPTLSLLFGLPIPKNNLGMLIEDLFQNYSNEDILRAYQLNAYQMMSLIKLTPRLNTAGDFIPDIKEIVEHYNYALDNHTLHYLHGDEFFIKAKDEYARFLQDLKGHFTSTLSEYKLSKIFSGVGIALVCSLALLFHTMSKDNFSFKPIPISVVLSTSFHIFLVYTVDMPISLMGMLSWVFCSLGLSILIGHWNISMALLPKDPSFILGSIFHIIMIVSLGSSSFIEEEHQLAYFFMVSLYLFAFVEDIYHEGFNLKRFIYMILFTTSFRIARKWNQTGNKWLGTPDIAVFLTNSNNAFYLNALILCTGILLTLYAYYKFDYLEYPWVRYPDLFQFYKYMILFTLPLSVLTNFNLHADLISSMARWVVLSTPLLIVLPFVMAYTSYKSKSTWLNGFARMNLFSVLPILVMVTRSHNLFLFILWGIQGISLWNSLSLERGILTQPLSMSMLLHLVSTSAYFVQGNSNSLSTIDVGGAFIGSLEYNETLLGTLTVLNTYAGNIVFYFVLALVVSQTQKNATQFIHGFVYTMMFKSVYRGLYLAFLLVILTLHRSHLFVWSVFAPKLVYEIIHLIGHIVFLTYTHLWVGIVGYKNKN